MYHKCYEANQGQCHNGCGSIMNSDSFFYEYGENVETCYIMQVLGADGQWHSIHLTGGSRYEYDTYHDAHKMLSICYPDQIREHRLGGTKTVRVIHTTLEV